MRRPSRCSRRPAFSHSSPIGEHPRPVIPARHAGDARPLRLWRLPFGATAGRVDAMLAFRALLSRALHVQTGRGWPVGIESKSTGSLPEDWTRRANGHSHPLAEPGHDVAPTRLGVAGRNRTDTTGSTTRGSAIELRPPPTALARWTRRLDSNQRGHTPPGLQAGTFDHSVTSRKRFRSRVPEPPNHCGRFASPSVSAQATSVWCRMRDSNPRCKVKNLASRLAGRTRRELPLRLCPRASHPVGCGVSLHEAGCPAAHIPRRVHLEVARRWSAEAHPK